MSYREGARAVAPLAVAVGAFGVPFGVLARVAGLSPGAAIVMSATTFAGSAQFAAVSVLDDGGTMAAAVAAALLLNARYVPIGLSVAPQMHGPAWLRVLQAQLAVDESWAVSHRGEGRYDLQRLIGAGLVLHAVWVIGTAVGALGGRLVGDPEALGLDAAFPALFLALLAGQVHTRPAHPARARPTHPPSSRPARAAGRGARRAAGAAARTAGPAGRPDRRGGGGVPAGAAPVSPAWLLVLLVGIGTVVQKAVGPALLGGRPLPARVAGPLALLAPALLAALIVTQAFGAGQRLVLDARAAGLAAALLAVGLRAPVLVVVLVAAVAAAAVRAAGG